MAGSTGGMVLSRCPPPHDVRLVATRKWATVQSGTSLANHVSVWRPPRWGELTHSVSIELGVLI